MARASDPPIMEGIFDGTWRPNYAPPGPDEMPEVLSVADGIYECRSCHPPYRVAADGQEHAVDRNPRFETIAITVVDDRTVHQLGRRRGAVVFESTTIVAADGNRSTETRTASTMVDGVLVPIMTTPNDGTGSGPRPVLFRMSAVRVGAVTPGVHLLSGSWRVVERDLLNHEEDTTYRMADGMLTMSDGMGRWFTARLDGAVATYHGDSRFTGVSVRLIDERTIEESNLSGSTVVQVTRWQVGPDGKTMHVRFDDTRGHVMEQTGHKLP